MEEASTLEQALKLKVNGASRIASLSNMKDFELDDVDVTVEEISKINLIRGRYGHQLYKRFTPRGNNFSSPGEEMELTMVKLKIQDTEATDH